jgi:hypothetical protein
VYLKLETPSSEETCGYLCVQIGNSYKIVSKVILGHAILATTQRYLGKVTDLEAMRWIESLHG